MNVDNERFRDKNNSENSSNPDPFKELRLDGAERGVLKYIKKKEAYLTISGIFPIYMLAVNILNFQFILTLFLSNSIYLRRIVDLATPFAIFFIITIFALIQFVFLRKWKIKVRKYERHQEIYEIYSKKNRPIPIDKKITLTNIFYEIIDHMDSIKILFIFLNIFSIGYLFWGFDFFIRGIPLNASLLLVRVVWRMNFVAFVVTFVYLFYEWYHFLKWNKKLSKLKKFERQIFSELKL